MIKTFTRPDLRTQANVLAEFLNRNRNEKELLEEFLERKKKVKHIKEYILFFEEGFVLIFLEEYTFKIYFDGSVERVCF